LNPHEVALTGT